MPTSRPEKPSRGNKKAAASAPETKARSAKGRPETPKGGVAKRKPVALRPGKGEDLYSSLFMSNHVVMLIIDPEDGRIIDANRAASRFYGYTGEELRARNISDINILTEKEIRSEMRKARSEKRNYFIFSHRLSDGTIRDVEVYRGPVTIKGRKLLYSIVHEITERKRAAEALRLSEKKYRQIVDTANEGIWAMDGERMTTFVNARMAQMLGYTPEEMIGRPVEAFMYEEDLEDHAARMIVRAQGGHGRYEHRFRTKDGGTLWTIVSATALRDEEGRFAGSFAMFTDITERKRAEEALSFEREQLLSLFESMESFVYVTDPSTNRILYANKALENALGKSVVGGICHREFQGLEAPCPFCTNEIILAKYPDSHHWEYHNPKLGMHFSIIDRIIRWPDGRNVRVEIATDITEIKRAEETLQESRNLLDATQRLVKVGGWAWDVARQTMTWTDETYRIHGMKPGEPAPGSPEHIARSLACYDPEDRPVIEEAFRRCADEGRPYDLEFPITTVDGRRIRIQTAAQPVLDGDRVIRVTGNIMDITDRKRTEEALRESEERFRAFMDNSPGIAWIKDEEGRHVYLSKSYERRFGVKLDDWRGKTDFDLWPLETARTFRRNDLAVLAAGHAAEVIEETKAPDGTVTYWWNFKFPILDSAGRKYIAGYGVDITDRKRMEEALRESERRYRLLVENAQFAVVVTSMAAGKVLFVNEKACALFEVPMEKAIGLEARQHWVNLEDREPFIEALTKTGKVIDYECALKTGTGAVIWAVVSATLIDYEGEKAAFIVYNDITERKRIEEALRDSLETASAMLNAATESFALIDSKGTVLAVNETFARRLGRAHDGIIGTSVFEYLSADLAEHRKARLNEVIQSGHPLQFTDEREGRWLEHSLYPIFDSRGRVSRLVIYAQDITERRRSEEALRQSEALLKSIFQAAPIGIGLVYNRVLGWTNDQVARMLGYTAEELAEKSARILYESDEEFERVGREKYIEVRQGGIGVIETRWKHRDGTLLDILLSSKAIDPSDIPSGVVFTALDITDRKRSEEALARYQDELEQRVLARTSELMIANQALILEIEDRNRAEKALRDSERRLSDIIEFLPDATFVIDRDGKVIAWNKSMETMTGIVAKDMLGRGNYEYAVPFYGERRPLLIDLVLSAEEEIAGRYANLQRRGDVLSGESYLPKHGDRKEEHYYSGTAAPLYDGQGNLVGAIESIRDITESKRAEEALRYRDAILEVASFAAERFLKAPSWETDIREILARLGTVTGASRVYIFENRTSEEGVLLTSQRYEWVSDGIRPEIGNTALQGLAMEREGFARWADIMRKGGHLSGLVRELPESERALLQSQDILSIASVPIYLGDRWWGFMGYDDCLSERRWSDVEMEALSVVASTLSAAISRKHTEARLVQTSERLSVVLESLPIVTFTAKGDEQAEITYITGTVEEITGFRPEEFLKDPGFLMDHVHPDDRTVVRSCHLGIGTKGMCGCEFRFRAANGTYRWFSEFCRLIHGPEGSIGRIVGMWQDVTEEKRILQESNTRLQQVIQAHKLASLGEIVAGVVHEINNPNSFITYNIPLLEEIWNLCEPVVADYAAANPGWGKRDMSYEELRNDMAEIINAFRIGSDRINRVVSNLKDFARAEEGVQAKPVAVNDVIEKTLMIVGGQVRRSVSRLDLDLGGDLPMVQGQFQKLEQVMANILVNAHQAIPDKEKGWIRISSRYIQRLGSVVVTIEDNGNGMTRPVIDRLFEPFFTTRRDTGGTGLGLSVSYGLIQEHQGVIGALSRPGIGTRFTVFLPARPGTQLNLRPLILPLERDLDRLDELQMEVSGIDDGFVHWFYHYEPSAERLAEYLDQHPEVDIILMTEPPSGLDPAVLIQTLRERFPLLTTVAWGGVEKDFTGAGGEKPDIYIKGPPDIRKLKGVIDGITRQRF